VPVQFAEVVGDAARADQQHALVRARPPVPGRCGFAGRAIAGWAARPAPQEYRRPGTLMTAAPRHHGRTAVWRSSRACKPSAMSNSAICWASAGSPGAGYCTANSSLAGSRRSRARSRARVAGADPQFTAFPVCGHHHNCCWGVAVRRQACKGRATGARLQGKHGEPWEINRLGSMNDVLKVKMRHLHPDH
jgi:hypothetical protein